MYRLLVMCTLLFVFITTPLIAADSQDFEINDDGRALIQEASKAFSDDFKNRPVVTDPAVESYAAKILDRLTTKKPPPGIDIRPVVIENPRPECNAYMDGHVVMTTGLLYAMNNEAQLAGVLAPAVAHLVEGYYLQMYQQIKAAERKERRMAAAGALFGAMLDVAVDYTVDVQEISEWEKVDRGEATYSETLKRLAALNAAKGAYTSIKDVVTSIPATNNKGKKIDPRLRFEPVSDAQGMVYMARAGYDPEEAAPGWEHLWQLKNRILKKEAVDLGPWAEQMNSMQSLMDSQLQRMQQSLGRSGLVQTPGGINRSRAVLARKLVRLSEVRDALGSRKPRRGEKAYREFVQQTLYQKAEQALMDEDYDKALSLYGILYEKGEKSAPVAYGMAKSKLGDFAFGASEAEKRRAEKMYREAISMDEDYAPAWKGLGELYADWDRFEEAADAYEKYVSLAPRASDRKRIERKIKMLKRKANR